MFSYEERQYYQALLLIVNYSVSGLVIMVFVLAFLVGLAHAIEGI